MPPETCQVKEESKILQNEDERGREPFKIFLIFAVNYLKIKRGAGMKIILNGQRKELNRCLDLKSLIEQFCRNTKHVVAEVNGNIIKRQSWENTALGEGDRIELVNLVGGG